MKKFIFIIFFFNITAISAQELSERKLDSLYNLFLRINNITVDVTDEPGTDPEIIKCGLGLVHQIKSNLSRFSPEKQLLLKSLTDRPTKETSMVSPSGFFRIHYNTSGTDVPRYNALLSTEWNVEQVAIALDSSYNYEVNFLGYVQPPPDNNAGGDNKYDVYINNLGGVYGYTMTDLPPLGNQKHSSYIVIDNDYTGFYSAGLEGMQVTVAHELHHGIQVGSYTGDKLASDLFFYELTSTAMEEFVYDSVNDYYAYMPAYFNNTSVSLGNTDGYEIAIWNIYLKDKFGYDIIKKQWELLPTTRALTAINTTLNENNSSFKEAFNEFGVWCFFTKHRANQGEYFEEAAGYPIARSISSIFFEPPDETIIVNSKPVVNSYISFINRNTIPHDSLIVLVSNADYNAGISVPNANFPFEYTLFNHPASGSIRLNDNFDYYFVFNVDEPQVWNHSEFLGNELIGEHKTSVQYDFAFPSPFIYNKNTSIFIPVTNPETDEVDLNIYSPSMDLIYISGNQPLGQRDGQAGIVWNVLDNNGQRLASGVYIYAVKSGDKTTLGKLVIFNE